MVKSIGRALVFTLLVNPAAAAQFNPRGDFGDYVRRSLEVWRRRSV